MGNIWDCHTIFQNKTRVKHTHSKTDEPEDLLESIVIEYGNISNNFKSVIAMEMSEIDSVISSIHHWWDRNKMVFTLHLIGYGNIFIPVQSIINFGLHTKYSDIFDTLSNNTLGNYTGNIALGNTIRYMIDEIKRDKIPRVLMIHMTSWITRSNHDKYFSKCEYDLYSAIKESYSVPLFIIFIPSTVSSYSAIYPAYSIFETDFKNIENPDLLNFMIQQQNKFVFDQEINCYFKWWFKNYSYKIEGNHLVRPRLYDPKLLNKQTSLCCVCCLNNSVVAKPCFHMICQSCNKQSSECPLCCGYK